MSKVFTHLFGDNTSVLRVQEKDTYRKHLLDGVIEPTARMQQLIEHYRTSPEEFFPGMPIDALVLFDNAARPVAVSRIKRTTRVAEKASYRITDALAWRVRREAEVFASERARGQGVALQYLVSSPQQMDEDFVSAEKVVANEFRNGRFLFQRTQLTINDLVGFKIIGDAEQLAHAEKVLAQQPGMRIIERQQHRGHYNATNLLIDIDLPPVSKIIDDNAHRDWHQASDRGLDPSQATKDFPEFVESAARSVCTEVILTTYPELIESEFGRSLHELRIIRLRERQSYAGQIAQNVRYLIEYLFAVAYSPTIHVPVLPIKMWGRYLPDTVLGALMALFGAPQRGLLRWFLPD